MYAPGPVCGVPRCTRGCPGTATRPAATHPTCTTSAARHAHLTALTGDALRSRNSRGVADRWEHQSIEYVPFRPADVVRHLLHPDRVRRWAPVTPALFHLALVHTHGRSAVERAEAQAVRRLRQASRP